MKLQCGDLVLRWLRQEDCKFQVSLGYVETVSELLGLERNL